MIVLSSNDNKRIQSINSIETYKHGIRNKLRSSMWEKRNWM